MKKKEKPAEYEKTALRMLELGWRKASARADEAERSVVLLRDALEDVLEKMRLDGWDKGSMAKAIQALRLTK